MIQKRLKYLKIVLLVILLGILSRQIPLVPLFLGDLLYAIMVFFGVKMLLLHLSAIKIGLISLLICYTIEFLQIFQEAWMVKIRSSQFGHYVFGEGFLVSDLIVYLLGVILSIIIIKKMRSKA